MTAKTKTASSPEAAPEAPASPSIEERKARIRQAVQAHYRAAKEARAKRYAKGG